MGGSGHARLSVIIPVYNRERTIGRAIQSVLGQTVQDFEIIVVDDHSTDGTRNVLDGFRDPRIRCLHNGGSQGAAAARNAGITAAGGEYLAFLDSDDEWLPNKLEAQLALLTDPRSDCGLTCTGFFLVGDGVERTYLASPVASWYRRLHWICDLSPGTTLIVRRACVADVGLLDEGLPRLEDWDWVLRLSKRYRLAVVEQPLARVHRGTLPPADVVELSTRRFLEKHDNDLRTLGWYYRRQILSRHSLELAYWFYRERRFWRGNQYALKALVEDPFGTSIASWLHWAYTRKLPLQLKGAR